MKPNYPVTRPSKKQQRHFIFFIWKGNDKIKCTALINDIEDSGLKMLDIQSMILSQKTTIALGKASLKRS